VCFQIVLREAGYLRALRRIKRHKIKILLSSVNYEFRSQLHKKFSLLHTAIMFGKPFHQLRNLAKKLFGKATEGLIKRLLQIVQAIKNHSKGGIDREKHLLKLFNFKLDLFSRFHDICLECDLRFREEDYKDAENWLRSNLSDSYCSEIGECDVEIVSEAVAVKRKDFAKILVNLMTKDQKWNRLKSLIEKKIEGFRILIWWE